MVQALEIPSELLVGHWRMVHELLNVDWVFHENGTFSGGVERTGERVSDFTGTWVIEGTWLDSEYTSDTSGAIDVGYNDRDTSLDFTYNHFVIQTRTGKRKYDRVQWFQERAQLSGSRQGRGSAAADKRTLQVRPAETGRSD